MNKPTHAPLGTTIRAILDRAARERRQLLAALETPPEREPLTDAEVERLSSALGQAELRLAVAALALGITPANAKLSAAMHSAPIIAPPEEKGSRRE